MALKTDRTLHRPLSEMLSKRYPDFLRSLGLRLTSSAYDAAAFGNSAMILEGGVLRVQIVVDRSQVWADLAPPHEPDL